MSLLTVGTVAFDSVKTPFGEANKVIGGAATYISYAASFFTQDIMLSAIIGDDWPKEEILALNERGIDTSGLEILKGRKTFYWEGKYLDNMNIRESLVTDLNVLDEFNPQLSTDYANAQYVMLGNLTPAIQLSVLDQVKAPKFIGLDTMNFWIDIALDDLKAAISKTSILMINDEEARMLSGKFSLTEAAQEILALGPQYLIIKKGENGALLFGQDNVFFAPALPLAKVVDPTGAGDSFAGGLMGYLTNKDDTSWENMKRAIICGSTLASFCVEDFSLNKIKSLEKSDVEKRMQDFRNLVAFDF